MVAPINSNRPVQIPQIPTKDDAQAAPRGKSAMSVGHQAKMELAELTTEDIKPNSMGKLASMIAQLKFDAETAPDVPVEEDIATEEPAVELITQDAQTDKTG